jgi:hypothetical protein
MANSGFVAILTASDAARRRWSIAARVFAATFGGYAVTSLLTLTVPLVLGMFGVSQAQALLAVTTASFPVYAVIVMAVFHARSAMHAWALLATTASVFGFVVWLLMPRAG